MMTVIAVDGPSGVGKGTLCQALAQRLGWAYLDSGALYRLLALAVLNSDIDSTSATAVVQLLDEIDICFAADEQGAYQALLNGEAVGQAIRTERCANMASTIAAYPAVRTALLDFQRDFAQAQGLVADGRDMGTVVFPQAPLKIFLTASAEVRAKRRYKQLKQQGQCDSLAALTAEIAERDKRDAQRTVAPLTPASDAVMIATDTLTVDEVLAQAMTLAAEKQLI